MEQENQTNMGNTNEKNGNRDWENHDDIPITTEPSKHNNQSDATGSNSHEAINRKIEENRGSDSLSVENVPDNSVQTASSVESSDEPSDNRGTDMGDNRGTDNINDNKEIEIDDNVGSDNLGENRETDVSDNRETDNVGDNRGTDNVGDNRGTDNSDNRETDVGDNRGTDDMGVHVKEESSAEVCDASEHSQESEQCISLENTNSKNENIESQKVVNGEEQQGETESDNCVSSGVTDDKPLENSGENFTNGNSKNNSTVEMKGEKTPDMNNKDADVCDSTGETPIKDTQVTNEESQETVTGESKLPNGDGDMNCDSVDGTRVQRENIEQPSNTCPPVKDDQQNTVQMRDKSGKKQDESSTSQPVEFGMEDFGKLQQKVCVLQ